MHVLFVNHTGQVSGAEHSLRSLMQGLQAAGQQCTLACPEGPGQALARQAGVQRQTVRASEASLRLHPRRTPQALGEIVVAARQVARLAGQLEVDVIHANSIRAALVVGLAAQMSRRPGVAHVRDRLPPSLAARASLGFVGATCRHVIANSRFTAEGLVGAHVSAPISVISNPVDREVFRPPSRAEREGARASLGLAADELVLGVVAQITPWKGQDMALRALAVLAGRHPQARLLLVGEAKFLSDRTRFDNRAYLDRLHARAATSPLAGRVDFLGERADVPQILGALDALLVPSHGEPFGRVVVEAMAVGTPVIASAEGGPAEVIEHGVNGLLAPADDLDAWVTAIQSLVTEPERSRALAAQGQVRSADFSVAAHVEQVLAVYRGVTATP